MSENTLENKPDDGLKGLPQALVDLMKESGIEAWEIEELVAEKGIFPKGMPIADYDKGYVEGVLIGAWEQVKTAVLEKRCLGDHAMPWEKKN